MIACLLNKNKEERLGSKDDCREILNHDFFADVDIDAYLNKKISSPYLPEDMEPERLRSLSICQSIISENAQNIVGENSDLFKEFELVNYKQRKLARRETIVSMMKMNKSEVM